MIRFKMSSPADVEASPLQHQPIAMMIWLYMCVSANEEARIKCEAQEAVAAAANLQVEERQQSGFDVGDDKYRKTPRSPKAA
jgi:hypothetical protein